MFPRRGYALFAGLFVNFLLYGGLTTILGATLPLIIRDLGWTYLGTGVVIAANAGGYFATTFAAGLMVGRLGPRRVITLGLLIQAVGAGLFGLHPQLWPNITALVMVGVGQGTTEVVTNYSVIHLESPGQSRLMNLIHSAFTIGAVLAPLLVGLTLDVATHWRWVYRSMAMLSLLMAVLLRARPFLFPAPERGGEDRTRAAWERVRPRPLLVLLALMILLYVGAEMGISAWVSEFAVQTFQVSPAVGAYLVSLYWLGILAGRLLTSHFYHGTRPARVLLGFATLAVFSLLAALLCRDGRLAALMFFLTGLGFSAVYPLAMAIAGNSFTRFRGLAIGVVSTGGGVGACIFPFLMSMLADHFGIRTGFWFYLGVTALLWGATLGILWQVPRAAPTGSDSSITS